MHIDKLNDIVNKYNNAYHRTIKMKSVDTKWSKYVDFNNESINEDPKFKVGEHMKISKYESIFGKGYLPNWSEEVFGI